MQGLWRQSALLLALVCSIYYSALENQFHYDDFHSIVHNPHIRDLANMPRFFVDPELFSVDVRQAMYRPLLLCSYALNYALDGLDPAGYHLFNGFLHAINAVWVLLLARALGTGAMAALATALLFAVHPLNSEVIHYASSRSEVLMAFFFLASCLAFMRSDASGGWGWYVGSLFCGIAALLCKSVALVLVLVLPLCIWWRWGDPLRNWPRYLPFVAVGLGYVVFSQALIGKALLAPVRPLDVQVWTQIKALLYYLSMGAMPVKLSADHQFFASTSLAEPAVFSAALVLFSFVWLLWRARRRISTLASLWAALVLAPTCAVPLIVLVNEHRLYLALVGWCLILGWVFAALFASRQRVALSGLAMYTIMLAFLTLGRGPVWSDELSLWSDAAAKGPQMLKPHLRLGDALVAAGRYREAEIAYLRALELRPLHPGARNNLGVLYKRQARWEEAEVQFRALLDVSHDISHARLNLAKLLLRKGMWRESEAELSRALEYEDTGGKAQKDLALIALKFRDDPQRALAYCEASLALAPDADTWNTSGVALRALGRFSAAEAAYGRALGLESGSIDTWFNLGNLYRELGQFSEALAAYRKTAELGGDSPLAVQAVKKINELSTITH